MKVKRKAPGVYTFTNSAGFSGEILKQPDGLWSVFDPKRYINVEYFHSKRDAVDYADRMDNPETVKEQASMGDDTLIQIDPWAWLDK